MGEEYDFCRVFVDGLGTAKEVEERLLTTGHYRLDARSLISDDVVIDVRRNKNGFVVGRDGPASGEDDWLGWPVTMEVFRDQDDPVPDATVFAVMRTLVGDLKAMGGRVRLAADYAMRWEVDRHGRGL